MTTTTTTGSRRVRGGGANTVVLGLLRSPARVVVQDRLCALRFAGRRTGTVITLPVEYTRDGDRIVVLAGHGRSKSWWRNFLSPHPVQVWLDGRWRPGTATAALSESPQRTDLLATYRSTHPRVSAGSDDPLVVVTLTGGDAPQRRRSLWLSWFGSVTLGECLGFAVPATVAAVTAGLAPAVSVPLLVLAGAVEGALLGWFQARVLRRVVPGLPVRRWTGATAAAAALAWTVGLMPSTLGGFAGWPVALLIAVAAIGALVLLGSIGTAQWLVLRARVRRAGHWIWVTAAAWVLALGLFTAVTTPLWQPGQSVATIVLIGVLGGVVMAATVAAVTGLAVVRLFGRGGRP